MDEMTCFEGIYSDHAIDAVSKQEVVQFEVFVEVLDIFSDPILSRMVEVLPVGTWKEQPSLIHVLFHNNYSFVDSYY